MKQGSHANCSPDGHGHRQLTPADPRTVERAARLLRAMGDHRRLELLRMVADGEVCVGELVERSGMKFSTISQRLRILRTEGLLSARREGLHVFYRLADGHVMDLLANAVAHAEELMHPGQVPATPVSRPKRAAKSAKEPT